MKKRFRSDHLDAMQRDWSNWKGPFYVNSKDPRLFVPKFTRWLGYTLNFGNPYSWIVLGGFAAIIVLLNL